jgi:hypothetical protein
LSICRLYIRILLQKQIHYRYTSLAITVSSIENMSYILITSQIVRTRKTAKTVDHVILIEFRPFFAFGFGVLTFRSNIPAVSLTLK